MAYVTTRAHSGIESIGVKSPLISWNTIMQANITKMLCSMVADLLAIVNPSPDITRANSTAARYIKPTLPVGARPYTSHPTNIPTDTTSNPTAQKGISFDSTNANLPTGVTFIASIVPDSFSLTRFSVGRNPHIMIISTTIRAGIIKYLKSSVGLNRFTTDGPIVSAAIPIPLR